MKEVVETIKELAKEARRVFEKIAPDVWVACRKKEIADIVGSIWVAMFCSAGAIIAVYIAFLSYIHIEDDIDKPICVFICLAASVISVVIAGTAIHEIITKIIAIDYWTMRNARKLIS